MLENENIPDKFGVLYHQQAGSMFWGYYSLVPGINSVCLEAVWIPLSLHSVVILTSLNTT